MEGRTPSHNEDPSQKGYMITGLESFIPEDVLTNEQLAQEEKEYASPKEEGIDGAEVIEKRTGGMKSRPTVMGKKLVTTENNEQIYETVQKYGTTDLMREAGKKLLSKRDIPEGARIKVYATSMTPDHVVPAMSARLIRDLNLGPEHGFKNHPAAIDTNVACSGWVLSVDEVISHLERYGKTDMGLVFAGEVMTALKYQKPNARVVFGDGGVATMIERETEGMKGLRVLGIDQETIPQKQEVSLSTELSKDDAETTSNEFVMYGPEVYDAAIELVPNFINQYFKEHNLNWEDIDYFIPHQGSGKLLKGFDEALNLGKNKFGKDKLINNVAERGNMASATVPMALAEHQEQLEDGARVLACTFAGGFTLGLLDLEVIR